MHPGRGVRLTGVIFVTFVDETVRYVREGGRKLLKTKQIGRHITVVLVGYLVHT